MAKKLNSFAFANSAAIVAALSMLILGILGNIGIYQGAVEMMRQWHMFFSLTPVGILAGMIEAAIISFVFFYIFGWIYKNLCSEMFFLRTGKELTPFMDNYFSDLRVLVYSDFTCM